MRILLFAESFLQGGVDTFIVTLIKNWPSKDDQWVVMCNGSHLGLPGLKAQLPATCEVLTHGVPLYGELANRCRGNLVLNAIRKLFSPALKYLFFGRYLIELSPTLKRLKADCLLVVNGGHPGGDSCRAALLSWRYILGSKSTAVYNFHNLASKLRWYEAPLEWLLDKWVCRAADRIVAVSQASADSFQKNRAVEGGYPIEVIYNGLNQSANQDSQGSSQIRQELHLPVSCPVVLMASTFEPRKGHSVLLKAFARVVQSLPAVHLIICGRGTLEEMGKIRMEVETLHLQKSVHLVGYRTDVRNLLKQSNVLVVPSQADESCSMISIEALSSGIPIIATNIGGMPEVVTHGEVGFCSDPKDADRMAEYLIKVLSDSVLATELGQRGYARFQERFMAERMASRYAGLMSVMRKF